MLQTIYTFLRNIPPEALWAHVRFDELFIVFACILSLYSLLVLAGWFCEFFVILHVAQVNVQLWLRKLVLIFEYLAVIFASNSDLSDYFDWFELTFSYILDTFLSTIHLSAQLLSEPE